ncbi:MAG: dipeptidase [Gammaproteobacteria bacterium]|nr:dipeptidase [Gammaproteobacteria bacterium]
MSDARDALAFLRANRDRHLRELRAFIAIPSVSTLAEHRDDVRRAADWLAVRLSTIGMTDVKVLPTRGHPVVYGEWLRAGRTAPTVLIYGHYDVQPVDPLELWTMPPFVPEQRGDHLYGRGASDMKGQVAASLNAVEAVMHTGALPVNIKWLLEGEEEIGSEHLGEFIRAHKRQLACDFCLNPDAGMLAPDKPTITTGLRGLAYFELKVFGPTKDLHSGMFGGVVHNPAQVLAELIAGMHDRHGKVTLPGFYERVRPLGRVEREAFRRLPVSDRQLRAVTGAPKLWGEPKFLSAERIGARPTLEVNGLLSGFTGDGSKTVLPAVAMAKLSCRLVPDQTPRETERQLRTYLKLRAPKTIRWTLTALHSADPVLTDPDSPGVRALAAALQATWGKRPYFKREGGSIGAVGLLRQHLGIDSVLTGFGLPDDAIHSPNERLHLPTWQRGTEALARLFSSCG